MESFAGLDAVDTPALIVDREVLRANVAAMAAIAARGGAVLRPHAKTHKSPLVARMQLEAGAVGLTVAKLSEAEVFAAAGVADLLIAYPLVGPLKLARLVALARRVPRLAVAVDAVATAAAISAAVVAAGEIELGVRLEVDTGLGRLGLPPASAELVALAVAVDRMPGLRFEGVMTHEGQSYRAVDAAALEAVAHEACAAMVGSAEAIRAAGVDCPVVSLGATPTARFAAVHPGVTELRPGTYVYNDRIQLALGAAREADLAAHVLVTVVSRPSERIACIDAGSKALTSDRLPFPGAPADHGVVAGRGWPVVRASEEHGLVELPPGADVAVGDRLAIVPNHVCPVVNLFDEVTVVSDGRPVDRWPVAARGHVT